MRSLVVVPWCKHRLVSWLECEQCAALSVYSPPALLLPPQASLTIASHTYTHTHALSLSFSDSLSLSLSHPASPAASLYHT